MMREQVHLYNVVKVDSNTVDLHTYSGSEALLDVFGVYDDERVNLEIMLKEDQVRALRDALNTMLGEP